MGAFKERESASDRTDILFVLGKYTNETKACGHDLGHGAVEFFIERAPEEQREDWVEFFGI